MLKLKLPGTQTGRVSSTTENAANTPKALVLPPKESQAPRISQSALTSWLTCPEKARLGREGWRQTKASMPLTYGSLVHYVLERVFRDLKRAPTDKEIGLLVDEAGREANVDRASAEQLQMIEDCLAMVAAVLPHYFKFWAKDFIDTKYELIEAEFRVPALTPEGQKYEMYGFFDRVQEKKSKLWMIDSKTSSRIDEDQLIETMHFDFQFMYFMLALWKIKKVVPAGAIRDIIRRPGLKQKQNETKQEYILRITQDIESRPDFYFVRMEVAISEAELRNFEIELSKLMPIYINWREGKVPTWRNTTACIGKFGACDMLPICARGDYSMHHKAKFGGRK